MKKLIYQITYSTSSNTKAPQLFVVLDLLRFAHLELPERTVSVSEYIRTSTLSIPWNNIHIAVAPSAVFTSGNPPISANPPLPTFAIELPGRDHSSVGFQRRDPSLPVSSRAFLRPDVRTRALLDLIYIVPPSLSRTLAPMGSDDPWVLVCNNVTHALVIIGIARISWNARVRRVTAELISLYLY